jgi:hypothetical protein
VKVQRPITANVRNPPALIYNRDRSLQEQFPLTQELLVKLAGDFKAYYWASFKDGVLFLEERAPEQEW